jgi:hypothetical protein
MSKRRRRRPSAPRSGGVDSFWGNPGKGPAPPKPIHATPDPAALLRSLGSPPLTPASAPHHLAVVYEEAVRAATALAAANGLLEE